MLLKWTKKRFQVALAVLDGVKSTFPDKKEFIDNTLQEQCEEEKTTPDEVIFYKCRNKELA